MAGCAAGRTSERFAAASQLPGLDSSDCQSFADSARFLQDLRLRHQLACQENAAGLDSLIDPPAQHTGRPHPEGNPAPGAQTASLAWPATTLNGGCGPRPPAARL
jgi:hypothetical protein